MGWSVYDEQLDKLISHGIIISDREKTKDVLKKINYYRLTGYALRKKSLIETIEAVISEYKSDIDLRLIGFPENYLEIMKNNL